MLVIIVNACSGEVVLEFPAKVYTKGTMADIPNLYIFYLISL